MIEKPDFCTEEHLEFLDDLRESGVTNMYGAYPYIKRSFPDLNREDSTNILSYWMSSFSEKHKK